MQANWSLMLNVILLVGVVVAISRVMKAKRENLQQQNACPPALSTPTETKQFDDIIAVRKVDIEAQDTSADEVPSEPILSPVKHNNMRSSHQTESKLRAQEKTVPQKTVMILLAAKENRHLAGYELLQTILAAGLRFGEGSLFHRHQQANGQGPILCSLAAATATGMFDLENIGAFSVRGLCLYMHASGNPTIDAQRFAIMLDTAKQLSDGLDANILDAERRPLTNQSLTRYYCMLNITQECELIE